MDENTNTVEIKDTEAPVANEGIKHPGYVGHKPRGKKAPHKPSPDVKRVTFTMHLRESDVEQLDAIAERYDIPRAALIKIALTKYIEFHQGQ